MGLPIGNGEPLKVFEHRNNRTRTVLLDIPVDLYHTHE